MIEIAFDFTSVASLLAYRPTQALAEELGVEVAWLPFPTPARPVPESRAEESIGERHARIRAEYVAQDAARYARVQGIALARDAAGVDGTVASAGCLWANRHGVGGRYVADVLYPFWANALDIEDGERIRALLDELGAPGFDPPALAEDLREQAAALAARGVFSAPTYLVAEQLFIGRAHLPMIRWLLGGQEGPGPL